MIFWTLLGVAIGYFFKPQIDRGVHKAVRLIKDNQSKKKYGDGDDDL